MGVVGYSWKDTFYWWIFRIPSMSNMKQLHSTKGHTVCGVFASLSSTDTKDALGSVYTTAVG